MTRAMSESHSFSDADRRHMAEALRLAAHGRETSHPNPRVGCVVVADGEVVGRGWHRAAGEPHAERHALAEAGERARGATLYVNLEPCSHHGRTPPCVEAVVEAGIARVVTALRDPDPLVSGRGLQRLESEGIEVELGLMEAEARALNAGFLSRHERGRPWIRLKLAASLDGKVAMASGESRWITGTEARADVQDLRASASAILTGVGTVLADDPRLTVRKPGVSRQPTRVVLDSGLRTPPGARLFQGHGEDEEDEDGAEGGELGDEVVIFTASEDADKREALEGAGARIQPMAADDDGGLDLAQVVLKLAELEYNEVLVEAGPRLAGALISAGLVDELILYQAPVMLGHEGMSLAQLDIARMDQRVEWEVVERTTVGADQRLVMVRR